MVEVLVVVLVLMVPEAVGVLEVTMKVIVLGILVGLGWWRKSCWWQRV